MTAQTPRHPRRLFDLGECRMTPAAAELLEAHGVAPIALLARHAVGDWGGTCPEDVAANHRAIRDGSRIIGFYSLAGDGSTQDETRVWVITDAVWPDTGERWLTTILTPREY